MGQCINCEKIRSFHSRRNWLSKGYIYRVQQPYSSISAGCASLLPITCIVIFIAYMISTITDPTTEDSNYTVTLKDADVHFRPSAKYYNHFYEYLKFQVDDVSTTSNFTATIYQQYSTNGDSTGDFKCSDYTSENPLIASLTSDNNYTNNQATLCYYKRTPSFSYGDGLVLCRNTNIEEVQVRIYAVPKDICTKCSGDNLIIIQPWKPQQSVVITLQLYIRYDWSDSSANENSDNLASDAAWRENYLEIVGVEEYMDREINNCYGIQVRMHRTVYEIHDGSQAWTSLYVILSLLGGAYSVIALIMSGGAICCETLASCCCKKQYENDEAFIVKFNKIEDERMNEYGKNALEDNVQAQMEMTDTTTHQ